MKSKVILFIICGIFISTLQISSCNNKNSIVSGEAAVKKYYYTQTDSLLQRLNVLDSMATAGNNIAGLKGQFGECRFNYKRTESISEYYFQGLIKRVNGPALPDVKTEDGQVWPPHGFQVIEQILYKHPDSLRPLSAEIKLLQTDLRFMRTNMEHNAISANHMREIIQHQFIRIAALGITGFDAPLSKLSLTEAAYSLHGIREIATLYEGQNEKKVNGRSLAAALQFLTEHSDFDSFNRLVFITDHLMPLSKAYDLTVGFDKTTDSSMVKPFRGTLSNYMRGEGFDADYYSSYANAKSDTNKITLGKKLFFDNNLSRSGTVSCGSCHKPELYFTDGKEKAGDFVHGGSLPRNTPSLYYAAFQSHQFYDLRSVTLEDQADQVMRSSREFNFSSADIAKKLLRDSAYSKLFLKAFEAKEDTISGYRVRNALAAYVRSLSPFSSPFDEYMKGNKKALSAKQIDGFNLFAGKAKCATCHFVPLFNGNIPPWLTKSESEIIGVPAKAIWKNATIDRDSGRYNINRMQELLFAFKTPTVRNAEKTAPYMHNGVYKNLDDVVEFYHKGGGVGLGITLPFQSLPFDSLSLNKSEKTAIVSFMRSLTDKQREDN